MAERLEFGFPRRHYRLTDSTNERARQLAVAGAPGGTVVTADVQSAGRGRRGRSWSAPPGGALLYTGILRPLAADHHLIPLAAPVAACKAIEGLAPVRCEIKWPNDIWLEERKVGGVLIEARAPEWALIGVGINVAFEPEDLSGERLRWPAASVGHGVEVGDLVGALSEELGLSLATERATILEAYRARDALTGRRVSWREGGEARTGIARGIDGEGNLLVGVAGARPIALAAGEVSLDIR